MCGVIGIHRHANAVRLGKIGMHSLKHRGKNGAGLACKDSNRRIIITHKETGPVQSVLGPKNVNAARLVGDSIIGHVRYPTLGSDNQENVQPHEAFSTRGKIVVADNGDIVDFDEQVAFLRSNNIRVYSQNEAEMIAAMLSWQVAAKNRTIIEAARKVMRHVQGAYAALFFSDFDDNMYAMRDPYGIRPLVLGEKDGATVFASETCALEAIGATYIRDVKPGELIISHRDGFEGEILVKSERKAMCVFESIYFMRPDSFFMGVECQHLREMMGRELAKEHPVDADLVCSVPKSGNPGAVGFAQESGIPFGMRVIENPSPITQLDTGEEIDRTFIGASTKQIQSEADEKYTIIRISDEERINGCRIVPVDDSVVRGTTAKKLTEKLRQRGYTEVHWRIPSPQITGSCFYGIATKQKRSLASREGDLELESLRIGNPESVQHLSMEGVYRALNCDGKDFCDACFTEDYPIPIPDSMRK